MHMSKTDTNLRATVDVGPHIEDRSEETGRPERATGIGEMTNLDHTTAVLDVIELGCLTSE